jgi:tetratricopeptide (TPR) repeat protein
VHYELGHASGRLGDYAAANEHLLQALDLFTELGDQASVGRVRHGLAQLLTVQGRYDEALDHAVEALRLRRASAGSAVIAYSENAVGWILAHLGQADAALWYCRRALEMHTESGSRTGIADTLDSIAYAYGRLADHEQSIAHYQRSIEMYRLLGDLHGEAGSRLHLGDVQHASGLPAAARRSWEQALALFTQIPGADTGEVSGRLRTGAPPDDAGPAGPGAVRLHTPVSELFHPDGAGPPVCWNPC